MPVNVLLVRFTQGMDGLLGVAGMMTSETSDDWDHSLASHGSQ